MTILVGILCRDGAVIAADRQISFGSTGAPSQKVVTLGDNAIFAACGHVGAGQQMQSILSNNSRIMTANNFADTIPPIRKAIMENILFPSDKIPKNMAHEINQALLCECLYASVFKDGLKLAHIDLETGITDLIGESPFCCLGGGGGNGMSFLAFIWSVFFSNHPPSLSEGVLAAYWTVQVAIDLRSPHVGLGINVCTLCQDKNPRAQNISENELHQHNQFIHEARNALLLMRDKIGGQNIPPSAPPPSFR